MGSWQEFFFLSDAELAQVDAVAMNLLVAKGIPSLCDLDVGKYQRLADEWAAAFLDWLPARESVYWRQPEYWKSDLAFFRLGMLCCYTGEILGIGYIEEQKNAKEVLHTDPSDLFLNGVMDKRRGTCANMALLQVALGRRLGWPVSLTCAGFHFLCRYNDGRVQYNIEATDTGRGGFSSPPDDYLRSRFHLSQRASCCGSDLHALTPRQMLGVFLGARGAT